MHKSSQKPITAKQQAKPAAKKTKAAASVSIPKPVNNVIKYTKEETKTSTKPSYFMSAAGVIVPISVLPAQVIINLRNKLSLKHFGDFGAIKVFNCYSMVSLRKGTHEMVECIRVPRTYIRNLAPFVKINTNFADNTKINCELKYNLFDSQKIIADHLMNNIFTPKRRQAGTATAILEMPTGTGKTMVAASLISQLREKTLFITVRLPLADQAIKDFTEYFGGTARVKKYTATKSVNEADIFVVIINTACSLSSDIFRNFGLVIMDEVHEYCTPSRYDIFSKSCAAPYVLGMSATIKESKNPFIRAINLALGFDDIIVARELTTFDQTLFEYEVKIINYYGPNEYTKPLRHASTGKIFIPYMIEQLSQDEARMKLAVSEIFRLVEAGRYVYAFAEYVSFIDKIVEYMERMDIKGVFAPESSKFVGGIGAKEIEHAKNNCRILLTTYAYSGTGVSITKMDSIVFLTSRKANMLQILGRIGRTGGDASIKRIVIDIVDRKTSFARQLSERKRAYHQYKCKIVEADFKPAADSFADIFEGDGDSDEDDLYGYADDFYLETEPQFEITNDLAALSITSVNRQGDEERLMRELYKKDEYDREIRETLAASQAAVRETGKKSILDIFKEEKKETSKIDDSFLAKISEEAVKENNSGSSISSEEISEEDDPFEDDEFEEESEAEIEAESEEATSDFSDFGDDEDL